jgi:hypothetical protein
MGAGGWKWLFKKSEFGANTMTSSFTTLTPTKLEFFSQDEEVTIIPNRELPVLHLLSVRTSFVLRVQHCVFGKQLECEYLPCLTKCGSA